MKDFYFFLIMVSLACIPVWVPFLGSLIKKGVLILLEVVLITAFKIFHHFTPRVDLVFEPKIKLHPILFVSNGYRVPKSLLDHYSRVLNIRYTSTLNLDIINDAYKKEQDQASICFSNGCHPIHSKREINTAKYYMTDFFLYVSSVN